ncbi:hypothetical protein ASF40_09195 [Microbacterium sp. Leaf288]|uniref:ester cyclase n=1 Tax=Microbacterium sp. Leaf288 TaxID=1736323 RepID=UPI0006FE091E|nr:ester cyclase [Microbacterium sp. Leaf288]KQP70003.1 hypothetical protein ASF40_09195 [Microbacterium sp. Leaf288]
MNQNKEVVRQLIIELDPRTARGTLAEVFADDVLLPADTHPNGRQGLAGMEEHLEFMNSIMEWEFDLIDMAAEGDTVAVRFRARGKLIAEFLGFSPDGRVFEVEEAQFLRFKDGKIAEVWRLNDMAGLIQQLSA